MNERIHGTIKAVAKKRIEAGQIGFLLEEEDKWYNMDAEKSVLEEWIKSTLQKGNQISFELKNGLVKELKLEAKAEKAERDDMTSFEDLLNSAHEKGIVEIRTELALVDWEKKCAVFKAQVKVTDTDKGQIQYFEAHGDATPENCGSMVKEHWVRMAETRAIARALRWATNNAATAKEETEN